MQVGAKTPSLALRAPLSSGTLLVDDVGLGETVAAALRLPPNGAERKRRNVVIVPSNLGKH